MKILCDTHVHCYQFEQLPSLLDSASANFIVQGPADARVLFFTDGVIDQTWDKLRPLVEQGYETEGWGFQYSESSGFIHANKADIELLLAPARQVNSVRRLEFLLLGCDQDVADGLGDSELVSQYGSQYAVVCPWGFGKWLGVRGKLLSELVLRQSDDLLLGDNGGRPKLWAWVPQFKQSTRRVLNGTDPLPITGELGRIAAFGICLELQTSRLTLSTLVSAIKAGNHQNYGKNLGIIQFLVAQAKMLCR